MNNDYPSLAEEAAGPEGGITPSVRVTRLGCRRGDVDLRLRIDESTTMAVRGWIMGQQSGKPWSLSRTKRLVDAGVATVALVVASPLMIAIAIAIKLSDDGPILFIQRRTGYRGRRFGMYKFRTMRTDAEQLKESLRHLNKHGAQSVDFKVEGDPRITPIGRILRKSSLDELPNLLNVIRGDMRLVGPRPTSFEASTYEGRHLPRLSVYPGITGLWQVSGRSDIDFDGRVELDVRYIRNQGPWQDLKILIQTPAKVIQGDGAA